MNAPVKQDRGYLRSLASALLNRISLFNLTGTMFSGNRDFYEVLGYKRVLVHQDFLGKYRRQDVARRIIHAPTEGTWSDPPELKGTTKVFQDAWTQLAEEQSLFQNLNKLDVFAGLGQFAVMLIGLDDGMSLEAPVSTARNNKVIYLQPYLEGSVRITKFEEAQSSPRFGQPTMYEIQPGDDREVASGISQVVDSKAVVRDKIKVHHSRILHVADNTLENVFFGHSRLEHVYNLLDDLMKVVGGSAETYWMAGNRGVQIDVDKDMSLESDDLNDLSDEVEEYQHGQRRFIRTRGVKIENLGSDVADPKGTFDVIISMISAATNIPKRVLIGVEAGQLASQQDRANWAVMLDQRTANWADPKMLRPTIIKFQDIRVLPKSPGLTIHWPDFYKMSPLERAQTSAQMARSMVNATKALNESRDVGKPVWSIEETRRVVGFGKHMPIFEGTPEGEIPEPKTDVQQQQENQPFGGGNNSGAAR